MSQDSPLAKLTQQLERPEVFGHGDESLRDTALQAAKAVFDSSLKVEPSSIKHINGILASLTSFSGVQTRSMAQNKAANPEPSAPVVTFNPTPLTSLFVNDLEEEQVWAQLELRTKHICELLDALLDGEGPGMDEDEDELRQAMEDGGFFMDDEDEEDEDDDDEDEEGEDMYGEYDVEDEDESMEDDSLDGDEEFIGGIRDEESESEDEDEGGDDAMQIPTIRIPPKRKQKRSEVDDDFFDLADFKAEVEKAESKSSSRGQLAEEDESEDEGLDDVDLFAPVEDMEDMEEEDTKEIHYSDFFEPPPRVPSAKGAQGGGKVRFQDEVRVKKIESKAKRKAMEREADEEEDEEFMPGEQSESDEEGSVQSSELGSESSQDEGEHARSTMDRLQDDLFADDDDEEDSQKDMTAHQKRMAAIQEQIQELETENVSRKDWTLMGEADARARPQNSLLEEDLEFDRVMKPVPLVTEEKVQSLEELIKARILENRFDDVVRLRPVDDKAFLPSRLLELQDSKSSQSLAEIYENDYLAAQGTGSKVDDRDGKLKKEHDEITALWDKISEKLDALSNAHFVPKQPKSIISTLSDVSTATLESALPTAKSATSMLAPEEVFSAQPSQLQARSELTPTEKRALRTKERKAKKKQRDTLDKAMDKTAKARSIGGMKKQKQAALESIVKQGKGVTVVGKSAKDIKSQAGKRHKK